MPEVSVIRPDKKTISKKNLLIITGLIVLIVGIIAAVILVQLRQEANIQACSCNKYNFLVTSIGSVTVTNDQTISEPAQKATVSINGSPVATLDVPALEPGRSATLGTVEVPEPGNFTWSVVGSRYCSDSGSYQGPSPTPSPSPIPSPTPPEATVTPTTTVIPTITEVPTSTPVITQVPTVTTAPSATPTSNPPDNPPSPPNRCNGDCHSDNNCAYAEDGTKLICVNNFCRHQSCTDQISCHCPPAFPTTKPSPTPAQYLAKSGDAMSTVTLTLGGFLLIGLGALLAL
jgi:hypothetical protein